MAVESNIYALWAAKQTAKGTPATSATKRLIQVGGDINTNPDHGSENFSDLDRFGDMADFVNTVVGEGSPAIQMTHDEVAYLCWLFFGTEVFTAKSAGVSPPKFVFEPGTSTSLWATFWKRVGLTDIVRQKFNDCKVTALRLEGSTANKVCKITPTLLSIDPGEIYASDPTPGIPTPDPFVYTEAAGQFVIDGVTMRGQSQFAIVINNADAAYYGDDAVPYDVVPGNAGITLEGVTFLLDAVSLPIYNKLVYGTTTPMTGAKPAKTLPPTGSYQVTLTRGTLDSKVSVKIEIPVVKWSPDVAVAPNPDGGPVEIALAGSMRKQAVAPKSIRITVETGAGDSLAHTV